MQSEDHTAQTGKTRKIHGVRIVGVTDKNLSGSVCENRVDFSEKNVWI